MAYSTSEPSLSAPAPSAQSTQTCASATLLVCFRLTHACHLGVTAGSRKAQAPWASGKYDEGAPLYEEDAAIDERTLGTPTLRDC